ncbi:MAG: 16S rRNA (guanine(527)-N(7))-methyltransferase RsmG [Pseudomonadales bacterium]
MPEVTADPDSIVIAAAALDVALERRQAETLLQFGALLLRWNRAFNLISRRDTGRLLPRHLLDSLSIAPWLVGREVMDLGTGAGLPGVPLAIAREDLRFTLVDRSERKIRFIKQVVRALELANVSSWCGDVRSLPDTVAFDTIVCRAVAPPGDVWALAGGRIRLGGRMLIMHRGQSAPTASEEDQQVLPGAVLCERVQLQVPGLQQSHELLVLDRTGPE